MSDTGEPDFSPGDVTPQTVQAADITPVITISPDDPTFQAPSIMGAVDYSGSDLPVQGQGGLENIAEKIWNLPNTALGLAYGGAGYLAGVANYELGGQEQAPGVQLGNNAIQFTDNPLTGLGAMTIGNTEIFGGGPSDTGADTNSMGTHEQQHTYQGEQLGPLYLPSNLLGGLTAEVVSGYWHGPQNWNETGPQQNPPVPWPK